MDKRDAAGFCLSLLLNPFSEDFSLFVVVAVVDLFFLLIYLQGKKNFGNIIIIITLVLSWNGAWSFWWIFLADTNDKLKDNHSPSRAGDMP